MIPVRKTFNEEHNYNFVLLYVARPQITTHPLNKLVEVNNDSTNVTFTCMAEGASSYFWERRGDNIADDASGNQTNRLTLVTLIPPDAGQYRCVALNEHGSNESDYARLTIKGTLIIVDVEHRFVITFIS